MKKVNKSSYKSYISLSLIVCIIYAFLLKTIKYSINTDSISYSIKFSYLYFELISSNIFVVFIIPIYLYLHKYIYNLFYNYKIIINYSNIVSWWNLIFLKTIFTSIKYTLIINVIILSECLIKLGFERKLTFNIVIYLFISIVIQISFFIILAMIMNVLMFIIKKFYLWFIIVVCSLLLFDNIFSTLRIFNLNLKNILFFTIPNNLINYSDKLFLIGFFIFTIIIIYEIGIKVIAKTNILWEK